MTAAQLEAAITPKTKMIFSVRHATQAVPCTVERN